MTSIISVILVLGGLIFFHELGHYLAARMLGIGVHAFSLGFGPRLFGWRRGKTDYKLSLIPLGGYVSLAGENGEDSVGEFGEHELFSKRPAWHRLIVVAAGPIFNLLLAWLIYWGLIWTHGQFILLPEVGAVNEGTPAAAAGVQEGDQVLTIDGHKIKTWDNVSERIAASQGAPITIELGRDKEVISLRIVPEERTRKTIFGDEERAFLIGIQASGNINNVSLPFGQAAIAGLKQTKEMIVITAEGVGKLIQRVVPMESVGGPIMIAQLVGQEANNSGLVGVLALAALISINLGLLNLLPVPVLDGGHIVFLTIEMIVRRPVPAKIQEWTTRIGVMLLLALMLLATYNDIVRAIQ